MNAYKMNLASLEFCFPNVASQLMNELGDDDYYRIEITRNDQITLLVNKEKSFYLHSKYNPTKEAMNFADENVSQEYETFILYGFGLGYHVKACLDNLKENQTLIVLENNIDIFKKAMEYIDCTQIIRHKQLKLIIEKHKQTFLNQFSIQLKELGSKKLFLHMPSVHAIPIEHEDIQFMLENWNITKSASLEYEELMRQNYEWNSNHIKYNVSDLFYRFKNKPVIIVGAGPSLDNNKHYIKHVQNKAIIFSSGTALKSLLLSGIRPDIFMIIDPNETTYKQIEGIEDIDIPAVFLSTASQFTSSKFRGSKLIAYQQGYTREDNIYRETIQSGGSVVTSMLDICIKMGCNPIAFVGVDLAYTLNKHHADNTDHGDNNKVKILENMRTVKGRNGEELKTTLGLLSFKKWIENKISEHKETTFINCTEGGVIIEGAREMKIQEFSLKYLNYTYDDHQAIFSAIRKK